MRVVNLPHSLAPALTHRYGHNTFKLHKLPIPRPSQVLGLVGTNGIGKSTALKLLAGQVRPNLGRVDDPADWSDVLAYFKGSELHGFFSKLLDDGLKAVAKVQYVDLLPTALAGLGRVRELLAARDERGVLDEVMAQLDLGVVQDRQIEQLSGGELQRLALALALVQRADVYVFDEPSSYLDVAQRLKAARAIRAVAAADTYVVAVEHDLAILDYLSDTVCLFYGARGAYGIVTPPMGVREGVNAFLSGYLPQSNLRFREHALSFKASADDPYEPSAEGGGRRGPTRYPAMAKALGGFTLRVEAGSFAPSEVLVLLGQNGTGKTTLLRLLSGDLAPDADGGGGGGGGGGAPVAARLAQAAGGRPRRRRGRRRRRRRDGARAAAAADWRRARPPSVRHRRAAAAARRGAAREWRRHLSGGEQQRVALALALGTPADVYLIDEPSAYLDSEQRLAAARVLKRFVQTTAKTAFVVEHDFIMACYLADRVVVYEGTPSVAAVATAPQPLQRGMNAFLRQLDVSFRRDPETARPRINKLDSQADREQKASGDYFFVGDV